MQTQAAASPSAPSVPAQPLPGGPPQVPPGYDAPRQRAPMPGARLAPDGNYYIFAPHERGNWRKVVTS
jgi:hypothetical protein